MPTSARHLFPLLAALALGFAWPPAVAEAPRRVVSLSLCSDELLLYLADRDTIASLSYLAADPAWSSFAELARGLPLNQARAEEVVALEPDLILSSRFSASASVNLLRRLGHDVEVLEFPDSLEAGYRQIRRVALLLDREARGEALIRELQSEVGEARRLLAGQGRRRALFYDSNGIAYGAGSLRHYFLQSLGWDNLAAELGLVGPQALALEVLLRRRPDYLLTDLEQAGQALAMNRLRHPALRRALPETGLLDLPDALFQCAGPGLAEAYRRLADQLRARERGE